ncbi:MAG: VCBS domain-containing protein [Gammaproteobacteria bacterium]
MVISYTVTLNDGNGGISITITGTNDIPVIGVEDLAGAVVEDAASPNITDSGIINFTDVDLSDAHSASAVFVSTTHSVQLGALSASRHHTCNRRGNRRVKRWQWWYRQ